MKFLQVDNEIINLSNITRVIFGKTWVRMQFGFTVDGEIHYTEFVGLQAERVLNYFENHADMYVA